MIPKLVAYRDKDGDLVEETVKKEAESNPLKLQQIGLNYDRAHLKASQWKSNPETLKDTEPIPPQQPKAMEEVKKDEGKVGQETSTVPATERGAVAESTDKSTIQPDTTKDDEVKRDKPVGVGSTAVGSDASQGNEQQPDVAVGHGGEGEREPEPVEQKQKAEEPDDAAKPTTDPWNAVCVVGLRVFSKDANLGLHLEES